MKVQDNTNNIAEYEYDGMNRRIIKKLYSGGSLSQTRHRYLSSEGQVIEERIDNNNYAERQLVWGLRYIDDLVLRSRDADSDETLDERLYSQHDLTYDIIALTDTSGVVVERYWYDPFGACTVLNTDFTPKNENTSYYNWEYRFTSREFAQETWLDYFRSRYYASMLGKFMSRDSMGYIDGYNLYAGYFAPSQMDPSGNVTRDFNPSKPDGMAWCSAPGTPPTTPLVPGQTQPIKYSIECSCMCSEDSHITTLECTVHAHLKLVVDTTNIGTYNIAIRKPGKEKVKFGWSMLMSNYMLQISSKEQKNGLKI